MINIPLNVTVKCTDGAVGKSTSVIINPVSRKVTHFVALDSHGVQRLVPLDQVEETSADTITLRCNRGALENMDKFIVDHYITSSRYSNYGGSQGAYYTPYVVQKQEKTSILIEEEQIPEGETSINRGTIVEATDGEVGKVDELLINPDSGEITHVILRMGQALSKKEIAIPVSAVRSVVGEHVYLKLDKQGISSLPAIPVSRPWEQISAAEVELMISTFNTTDGAKNALAQLQKLERQGALDVLNAAVLTKDAEGKASFKETGDIHPRRGALFGAIAGGLMGLVGGPVGVVVGAVAGATTGHVAAGKMDMGFPDEFLKETQKHLEMGSSALIVLADKIWADDIVKVVAKFNGIQVSHTVSDDIVAELLENLDQEDDPS